MTPGKRSKKTGVDERRQHLDLRETVEELLDHIRTTMSAARTMSDAELDYAQQRLEWLADEVWRLCLKDGTDGAPPAT